jgi:hypothetical protein
MSRLKILSDLTQLFLDLEIRTSDAEMLAHIQCGAEDAVSDTASVAENHWLMRRSPSCAKLLPRDLLR